MITRKELEALAKNEEIQKSKVAYQVSGAEMKAFEKSALLLASMIGDRKFLFEKENGLRSMAAYEALEEVCQISTTTMKKSINGTLKITRQFLYKFTVGLKMTPDEANKYFALCGGELNEQWGEDYICLKALLDKDDVYQLIEEFDTYRNIKLGLRERNDAK